MKALLLAAGFGTRLKPITNNIPKCLVPINGRPLLDIWLEKLTQVGINSFLINMHYLAENVESYIKDSPYSSKVLLVHEPNLLGTAGTLLRNINYFEGDEALVLHADNYSEDDISGLIRAHKNRPPHCEMTMMIFKSNTPSACGVVVLDTDGVVTEFYEKIENPPSNLANGAIYILSRQLLIKIKYKYQDAIEFSTDILPHLVGKIYTYETSKIFLDIGTTENYERANKLASININ
jgi:mannose-1-phosphate guanylyltransferase